MRVLLMVFILTLGLAAPARATPITLQFSGVVDTVGWSVSSYVAPGLSPGDPFLILAEFGDPVENAVTFSLGTVITGQTSLPLYPASLAQQRQATTLYILSGAITTPPTQWPTTPPIHSSGGGLQTLFTLTLTPGWQSGSMHIWVENTFIGAPVTGTVTHTRRVLEPATALLLALGLAAVARCQRRPSAARSAANRFT